MEDVGFVPFLTMITMITVLGLVWLNIQQTMDQLNKRRDQKDSTRAASTGSAVR